MNKPIVLTGYPKSGNTWATQLLADLLECPVAGFWQYPDHNEISSKGQGRVSDNVCYKSHACIKDLAKSDDPISSLYIVRDPRDIIVSAANFYSFIEYPQIYQRLSRIRTGLRWYHLFFFNEQKRIRSMTKALLNGHPRKAWLEVPWKQHVEDALHNQVPIIRYEDLKLKPLDTAQYMLDAVNHKRNYNMIEKAVEENSFQAKKKKYKVYTDKRKMKFLRSGKIGEGKKKIPSECLSQIERELGDVMRELAYL